MSTVEEIIARAIYIDRNGPGATAWGQLPRNHQAPYWADGKAAIAALDAAGYVIVPDYPSPEMLQVLWNNTTRSDECDPFWAFAGDTGNWAALWTKLLEARPK